MRHAPFGRPRHPLGTFPCGKVPRPPAGGRNLPQETDFLWKARKRALLSFFCFSRDFASAEATKGLSDRPLETFGVHPLLKSENCHKKQVSCGGQGKELYFLFPFLRSFRLCGGDQRAFRSPFGNLRPLATSRNLCKKQLPCRGQENAFLSFPVSQTLSPLRRRPGGFPLAPLSPFRWRKIFLPPHGASAT